MELNKAKEIAVSICYQLQPYCVENRLNIAGSIRRQKPNVKDIEITCVPKNIEEKDLFGEVIGHKRSPDFINSVFTIGRIVKGSPAGRMMQIELKEIMIDLFIPEPHDYFRQYAIRTGSSQYSALVIATAWKKKGWCGTPDGLRKIHQCEEKKGPDGKSTWKVKVSDPDLPPVWQSEKEFFEWLDVPFVNPVNRSM